MFKDVDVLSQCHLKHTLAVSDIRPISIHIPYYTNERKLCYYYNMFKFISFAVYNVESILLSSYVICQNDLLIHTMLFNRFVLLESFLAQVGIYIYKHTHTYKHT